MCGYVLILHQFTLCVCLTQNGMPSLADVMSGKIQLSSDSEDEEEGEAGNAPQHSHEGSDDDDDDNHEFIARLKSKDSTSVSVFRFV
jgi:hypothetical protein